MSDQSLPNWLHTFFPSLQMSRTQNEDTPPFTRPLVYSTVIKFPQQPLPFSQWLKSKQKAKKKQKTLLLFIQQFQFSLLLLPILFFVTVSSVSSLFNSSLFLGVSLSSFSSLPPQSISLQWPGRLTAAPPEEYQSMLLWRPNQAPLVYFLPLFSFPSSWPCMLLFMV